MTNLIKAYVACAIDGEGCITFKLRRSLKRPWAFDVNVEINNTNKKWLEYIQDLIGLGGGIYKTSRLNPRSKQGWRLFYSSKTAQTLLKLISKYLFIKRKQGLLALKHTPNITGKNVTLKQRKLRAAMFFKMKKLNKRGI